MTATPTATTLVAEAATHLRQAAAAMREIDGEDAFSIWATFAGQLDLAAAGLDPMWLGHDEPDSASIRDHLAAAASAIDRSHRWKDRPTWPCGSGISASSSASLSRWAPREHHHRDDLLARAEALAKELAHCDLPVKTAAWESFDTTVYRLLREVIGPARSDSGATTQTRTRLLHVIHSYPSRCAHPWTPS